MKALILCLALVGCATGTDKVPILFDPADPLPKLTTLQDAQLWDTFPVIYEILGDRDNMCEARNEYLEGLIRDYNE